MPIKMFTTGTKAQQRSWRKRPRNVRARDNYPRLTASARRASRKQSGMSARQQKRRTKAHRRRSPKESWF